MRHHYAGSKNRLGQRRDSELLAENDGSQQLLVYFLFQKFFISDARQASCQNNVGNLWIVTHGYIESLSGKCTFFFFFTSSFQLLLWQCCPYVLVILRYKNILVWVRKRSHFCFLLLWKLSQHLVKTIWFSTADCPRKDIQWCCHCKLIYAPYTCENVSFKLQYNNKRPLLRVELVSRPPVLLRCLVPDQSPLSSCAVSVCLCAWPM